MPRSLWSASFLAALIGAVVLTSITTAEQPKLASESRKVTVLINGVHCFQCVDDLRTALEKMKGIRFDPSAIDTGQEPRFFSEPFVIEIKDPEKTILGAVAYTVSETKTAHRRKFPPSLNLVMYTSDRITEEAVVALRQAVKDVNGLEPMSSGGVGGVALEQSVHFFVRHSVSLVE